jgi:hypothetical protein
LTASHEALTLQLLPLLHQAGFRATKWRATRQNILYLIH